MKFKLLFLGLFLQNLIHAQQANLFSCELYSPTTTYELGEVPKLKVTITHQSNELIYLVQFLDGSDYLWRKPYCYFTIEKPVEDSLGLLPRCGNTTPLMLSNFVKVEKGIPFDPFHVRNKLPYYTTHDMARKEHFRNKGTYKITFHYSTRSERIFDFGVPSHDDKEFDKRYQHTPKLKLKSNTLTIHII